MITREPNGDKHTVDAVPLHAPLITRYFFFWRLRTNRQVMQAAITLKRWHGIDPGQGIRPSPGVTRRTTLKHLGTPVPFPPTPTSHCTGQWDTPKRHGTPRASHHSVGWVGHSFQLHTPVDKPDLSSSTPTVDPRCKASEYFGWSDSHSASEACFSLWQSFRT